MKDLPHHIKKINRQVLRSERRETFNEALYELETSMQTEPHRPESQLKKQAKTKIAQEHKGQTPHHLTVDEKNKKMQKRVPIFDRNNAQPKHAKASRKKSPRI